MFPTVRVMTFKKRVAGYKFPTNTNIRSNIAMTVFFITTRSAATSGENVRFNVHALSLNQIKRNALQTANLSSCQAWLLAHALLHLRHFTAVLSLRTFSFALSLSPASLSTRKGSSRWNGGSRKIHTLRQNCLHSYVIENSSALLYIAERISRARDKSSFGTWVRGKGQGGGKGDRILLKIGVCLVDERDLSAISHEIYLPIL